MKASSFIHIALFFLLGCSLSGYSQQKVMHPEFNTMLNKLLSHSVPEVLPNKIDLNTVIFLDAREKQEYEISHIKNALWIGYNNFSFDRLKSIAKDQKIVVYCSVGYRSEKIAEKLTKNGYTNVSNLYGGIFEWMHEDKKVYCIDGETDQIHAYNKEWSQWLLKGEKVY